MSSELPPPEDPEGQPDRGGFDAATDVPDWSFPEQSNRRGDDGSVLVDETGSGAFGELDDPAAYPKGRFADLPEVDDLQAPDICDDPYVNIVSAWSTAHDQDVALYGRDSEQAAESDARLAAVGDILLCNMEPEIDEYGELTELEARLSENDDDHYGEVGAFEGDEDGDEADDDEPDDEDYPDDGGEEEEDEGGGTAVLDRNETEKDNKAAPELNDSPELAEHLVRLISDNNRENRGLPKNEAKRLRETPEVPQEDLSGLVELLMSPAFPSDRMPSGWEELQMGFDMQGSGQVDVHIFTYPQEVQRVVPKANERIDLPKNQGRLSGIIDSALGRSGDFVEVEVDDPDEAYFEKSNLLCYQRSDKEQVESAYDDPNGIRNAGPIDYDEGVLRSIGIKDYVNQESRYQYVVRADIGVAHNESGVNTRYVVYERATEGGGYVIARSDNDTEPWKGLKFTTYIPAVEEVRELTNILWVLFNSSAI